MSRPSNQSLKNESGLYYSKKQADARYEKNTIEQLTVRVPKGTRDLIKEHQERMLREHPDAEKYQSVNKMLNALIEEEIGQKLD